MYLLKIAFLKLLMVLFKYTSYILCSNSNRDFSIPSNKLYNIPTLLDANNSRTTDIAEGGLVYSKAITIYSFNKLRISHVTIELDNLIIFGCIWLFYSSLKTL